jgi:hypothetical protein
MPWGTRAAETYFAFSRRLDKLIDTDPRRDELSRRGAENAVRLATIVAVGRGSSTVDREDIEWAIKLAERSIEAAAGGIERYMRQYLDFPKFCERLLAKITACGGFRSESELRRDFRNNQKLSSNPTTQSANSQKKAASRTGPTNPLAGRKPKATSQWVGDVARFRRRRWLRGVGRNLR